MEALVVLGFDEGSEPFVSFHGGLQASLGILCGGVEDALSLAHISSSSGLRALHASGDSCQFSLLLLGFSVGLRGLKEASASSSNASRFSVDGCSAVVFSISDPSLVLIISSLGGSLLIGKVVVSPVPSIFHFRSMLSCSPKSRVSSLSSRPLVGMVLDGPLQDFSGSSLSINPSEIDSDLVFSASSEFVSSLDVVSDVTLESVPGLFGLKRVLERRGSRS